MFRTCILAAIFTSLLIGVGCGSSSKVASTSSHVEAPNAADQILGLWIYDPEHLEGMIRAELAKAGIDPSIIPEEDFAAMVAGASEAIDIRMNFTDDGKVMASSRVENQNDSFSATWTIDGNVVSLHSTEDEEVVEGMLVDGKLNIAMPVGVEGMQSIRLVKAEG